MWHDPPPPGTESISLPGGAAKGLGDGVGKEGGGAGGVGGGLVVEMEEAKGVCKRNFIRGCMWRKTH